MKRKQLYISALLLTAALQWSCIEDEIDTYTNTGTSTRVNIEVTIPGNPSAPQSRALTPTTENHIQDITVLVFNPGDTFQYRADATGIQNTAQENIKQFSVLLQSGQSDLWILANCKDILAAYPIPVNATKDMIRQNLLLKTTGTWNTASTGFTPLPMWGEKTGVNVTPELTLTGNGNRIPLIRAVAKIDLTIDRTTVPETDFTLEQLHLYHASNQGQVIPDEAAFGTDKTIVQTISGGTNNAAPVQTYTATERDGDGFFTHLIYVPETPAGTPGGTNNPCLLINATYQGTAGWYKAELLDKDTSDGKDHFLPLLRNYRYNAVITHVGGRGYESAEEAYKSTAQNLIIQIHTHSDATLTNVMYDGQYWLAWNPDKIELNKEVHSADDAYTDNILQIQSNCEDGWKITRITDDTGQPVTWLSIPDDQKQGAKNEKRTLRLVTTENTDVADRIAYVHFTAGRMDASVEVTQNTLNHLEIRFFDADDVELPDVFWVNTIENKIQERQLRVKWTPENANLSVTFTPDKEYYYGTSKNVQYESGGNIPADTVDGEGIHEYNLKFSELKNEEALHYNPGETIDKALWDYFYVYPYHTRYTFTLEYHGKQITKDIVIAHHLELFHLNSYQPDGYLMGGLNWEQRFSFIASAPFVAGLSNNHGDLFTFYTGEHGKFTKGFNPDGNLPNGDYNPYSWVVNVKNPTPERNFQTETVTIKFPESELPDTTLVLKTFRILPNCYLTPPGGTVHVPVRNPWDARWNGIASYDRLPLPELPLTGNFTCERLWEDVDGLIEHVNFTPAHTFDPYRTEMTVKTNGSRGEDNAVIALRREGTIIWSWHIWVTAYDPDDPDDSKAMYTYNDSEDIFFMDRNLGAIANDNTETNKLKSLGLYYQGERKDPFPPYNGIPVGGAPLSLSGHKPVYPHNDIFTVAEVKHGDNSENILRSIEHPTTFITAGQSPYDWYTGNTNNRWVIGQFADNQTSANIVHFKNIYDPCPEGWMVGNGFTKYPHRGNIWGWVGNNSTFFPQNNIDIIPGHFGIVTPQDDFYPASGFISHIDGTYREVGENVLVTLGQNMGMSGYRALGILEFSARKTTTGYTSSEYATGRNVRCMKIDYYNPQND